MIKAFIFDFFGVIGASTYQLLAENIAINNENIKNITDLHKAMDNGFISQEKFLHDYAKFANLSYPEFLEIYHNSNNRFKVSQKLLAYIASLRKKGFKIGLLSNVNEEAYKEFIKPIILEGLFDEVMLSYMVGVAKPEQKIFTLMAERLLLDPTECLMVDDIALNCEGAMGVGMAAIQYTIFDKFKQDLEQLLVDN